MKLLLPTALILLAAPSCKKEDEAVQKKSELPAPTCDVKTDDGKFEVWTSRQMLELRLDTGNVATKESPGGLRAFWMTKTNLKSNDRIELHYVQDQTIHLKYSIKYPNGESMLHRNGTYTLYEGETGMGPVVDSVTHSLPFTGDRGRGCARLYYQFVRNRDTIITQGHFDLSFE